MSDFEYLECECSSPEHTVRFAKDEDFVYMTFFLESGPWYRRVASAFRHIFGYKSRYGHFDEVVMDRETAARMAEILKGERCEKT
jgi:hypothetical protein